MSDVQLDPYIFFQGTCKEAMEFYKSVFGGELTLQAYNEMPDMAEMAGPLAKGRIMHASLKGGDINLMASDSTNPEPYGRGNMSLSLSGEDEAKLRQLFEDLSQGGKVTEELQEAPWGDTFGGLTDKFGIDWMINITEEAI